MVGIAAGRLDQAEETLDHELGLEIAQVVLERVGDPAVAEADVRGSLVLADLVAEHFLEQRVELPEVAEDDMTAEIPGEALGIDDR